VASPFGFKDNMHNTVLPYTKLPGSGIHFEGARCSGSTFQTTRADRLIHKQTSSVEQLKEEWVGEILRSKKGI